MWLSTEDKTDIFTNSSLLDIYRRLPLVITRLFQVVRCGYLKLLDVVNSMFHTNSTKSIPKNYAPMSFVLGGTRTHDLWLTRQVHYAFGLQAGQSLGTAESIGSRERFCTGSQLYWCTGIVICFTPIRRNLFRRITLPWVLSWVGLELTTSDSQGRCTNHLATA